MQNVRCTSLFKILSTKKTIFKKSEKCDQEKDIILIALPCVTPIRKSKTKY